MSLKDALKRTQEELGKALAAARELGVAVTDALADDDEALANEKQERFDKAMRDVEKFQLHSQKLETQIAAEERINTVVNEVHEKDRDDIDKAAAGPNEVPGIKKETLEQHGGLIRETFATYIRHGEHSQSYRMKVEELNAAVGPKERHALLGTVGTLGGALVPEDMKTEIIKNLAGYTVGRSSGMRSVPTSSSTLVFPAIAGGTDPWSTGVAGTWRNEGAQGTDGTAPDQQDQPTFANERIPVHVWQPESIIVTQELLEDSMAPLESIIAEAIAETRGHDEDYAFLRGTGQGQPKGIWQYVDDGDIGNVETAGSGAVVYGDLVDFFYTLLPQYHDGAVWYMRPLTFGEILKLKDSSDMPILYQSSQPGTLFGKKVWMTQHAPAFAAGAYAAVLGVPRFYVIAERTDMRLQRLEERFAPNVGFLPTARVGGGVVRFDAFKALKIKS